jgi:hypothetical protein
MKLKITIRSLRRWRLLVLAVLGLALAACTSARSTAATPTVQVALTQTATRIPTQYVTATPTPQPLTPSPHPTPTPALTETSTQSLHSDIAWSVKAIEVRGWPDIVWRLGWLDNTSLKVVNGDGEQFMVDVAAGVALTPTPTPKFNPSPTPTIYPLAPEADLIFSPDGAYVLECTDKRLRLYRLAEMQLIKETEVRDYLCNSVSWAPDSSIVAFIVLDQGVYTWRVDGTVFYNNVVSILGTPPLWSLDSTRFVVFHYAKAEDGLYDAGLATFDVVYADRRPPLTAETKIGTNDWEPSAVHWITHDELTTWHGCGYDCGYYLFFDANTGKELPGWSYVADASQDPSYSPDMRWRMSDGSDYDYTIEGEFIHYYSLFDLHAKSYYSLVEGKQLYLAFLDWSDDSTTFYVVSRPVTETAKANVKVPFGLLALNPQTREFKQLFEQAVFAKLSPDKKLAWVVFPAKHADGTLGLDGGIFNLADGTLAGRLFVSDRVLYANPAEGDLVSVAWSNDGTRVVFGDSEGNLTLVKTDGTTQSLATILPRGDWPANVHYAWSPDDRHLLVQYGDRAWIVSVP